MIVGRDLHSGKAIRLEWKNGLLTSVSTVETSEKLPYVAPGLCDLQINGYDGVDFNGDAAGKLRRAAEKLWSQGCTTFLPTLITNSPDRIAARLESLDREAAGDPLLRHSVPGFHLEGPFISPQDGPRGAHPAEHVRAPSAELVQRWINVCEGRVRILTLSPEWDNADEVIAFARRKGIVPSIGHTTASADQIASAARAGALCVTHFGNGAPLMVARHPNFMWQQLAEEDLFCTLIADGFHLPDCVLKVAIKVKGERAIVVSDATQFAGLKAGTYETHIGGKVTLTPEGRLHLAENDRLLAGSAQSIRQGVEHLAANGLMTLPQAWSAASTVPARLAGLPGGRLAPGTPADFVVFDWDGAQLNILETVVMGERVYKV